MPETQDVETVDQRNPEIADEPSYGNAGDWDDDDDQESTPDTRTAEKNTSADTDEPDSGAAKTEPADGLDEAFLGYAQGVLGLDADTIRGLKTRENVQRLLNQHNRLLMARGGADRPEHRPPPAEKTDSHPAQTEIRLEPPDLKQIESELPEAAAALRAMHEQFARALAAERKQYQAMIAQTEQRMALYEHERQRAILKEDMDLTEKTISAMPGEYRALLGSNDAEKKQTLLRIRNKAVQLAAAVLEENPRANVSAETVIEQAFHAEFFKDIERLAAARIEAKLAERRKQATAQASHRRNKSSGDPRRDAIRAYEERIRSFGASLPREIPEDELLDD